MSIFDSILSAVDNPEQKGSTNDIANIVGNVQRISQDYNVSPDTIADAVSIVGKYVKGSLQQKREEGGEEQVNRVVDELSETSTDVNPDTPEENPNINVLFDTPIVLQMIEQIGARTGLPEPVVRSILPSLVNFVVRFLQTGNFQNNSLVNNPIAKMFLDSDKDGDVDLGDAMRLASRYLGI